MMTVYCSTYSMIHIINTKHIIDTLNLYDVYHDIRSCVLCNMEYM